MTDTPPPRAPAARLNAMRKTLRDVFGITRLRPGQQQIIRSVLERRDTLAVMPTGAGKSLCYQLPALHLDGWTLVVSPLIALMKDQFDTLRNAGIDALRINSTLPAAELRDTYDALRSARSGILFVTPEQLSRAELIDTLRERDDTRIELVVVDEAHCVSQWGHDFRPAFLRIVDAVQALGRPPVLALTATATPDICADIVRSLGLKEPRIVNTGVYRDNLHYRVTQVSVAGGRQRASTRAREAKAAALREVLARERGRGIVYTATVREAEQLAASVREWDAAVACYHGRLPARERHDVQERFVAGELRVMIATNAFGMGVDIPDLRFVVHSQMPGSLDAYYQETGRAGRDGEAARCELLFDLNDRRVQQFLALSRYPDAALLRRICDALAQHARTPGAGAGMSARELLDAVTEVGRNKLAVALKMLTDTRHVARDRQQRYRLRDAGGARAGQLDDSRDEAIDAAVERYAQLASRDRDALQQMIDYAQTGGCRWRVLLEYFDDADGFERCGTCDNCLNPVEATLEAQRAQPAVKAPPRQPAKKARFGRGDAVRVRKYGSGHVVFATDEQVAVLFPDGSTRTFMARFVKAEIA
ncbi:ATP-dependent DNA helicase [Paraburkholderia sp. MMS20-SJTR3]|uniref:ATP-dependent DNA helicase RecQ n=1 Tax=Paraburkholderia sejongensis TaxID=2886946 RepID=A0ABS8JQZ1_9BURK|nr:ATP-dependent DNA helicase RecQ [Paraburkholderia sp. MMS20-SJTR3]MCC8392272.1 ATP-dependent DNA helicase [Paraburkholderia sp. MMS20-SJTR3]